MNSGDQIQYKNYTGIIKYIFDTYCIVTLYKYHGLRAVDKRIELSELPKYEQIKIAEV